MKNFFMKIFSFILTIVVLFPIIGLFCFLIVCKNYLYSILISAFTFYLILGFTGVSCFLAISTCVVLTYIANHVHNIGLKLIDDSMEKKMREISDAEKTQINRGFKIDDILDRMSGL